MANPFSLFLKKDPLLVVSYGLGLIVCFVAFKQSDLTHTYTSSYAYLHGHVWDFYEYNKTIVTGNDYLPLIYMLFALWNLPLWIFGAISPVDPGGLAWQSSSLLQSLWSKGLLVTCFFMCCWLIQQISNLIAPQRENTFLPTLLFATSPIAIFAVFIFSQYDILGVVFTLLGIYAYFQKQFWRFALYFSVAISFKYFASFIFLPLVLLIEKRPLRIVQYGLLGLLVAGIQIALYWHSEVFQQSFFALAGNKTEEALSRAKIFYIGTLYVILCFYAYRSKCTLDLNQPQWAMQTIFIASLAYALLFSLVRWHPQWLVILMPFIALSIPFLRQKRAWLTFELIAYIAFIWLCVNQWPKNVDVTMLSGGIFSGWASHWHYFGADLLPPKGQGIARAVFYVYLFSPFLLWLFQERRRFFRAPPNPPPNPLTQSTSQSLANAAIESTLEGSIEGTIYQRGQTIHYNHWWFRILVGGYFFIALTAVCVLLSHR
jgi:hypothetical protein